MAQQLETTHTVIQNELVVYSRERSSIWQCRFKVGGVWQRASTKERDVKKAIERAKRIHFEKQVRLESNLPVVTRKFRDIAKLAKQEMLNQLANPKSKAPVSFKQYIKIIDDYLIELLGNKNIDSINGQVLDNYYAELTTKLKRAPAYSTMRKHNVTLNRIFDKAVEKGFITQSSRPPLDTKGQRSVNYATFDLVEVNALLAQFPIWIEKTTTESKIEQRQMLYDYVRMLIDTGARPGKELLDLQWKNIRFNLKYEPYKILTEDKDGNLITVDNDGYDENGEPIPLVKTVANVQMGVWGKTKGRTTNGYDATYQVLNEIIKRNYAAEDATLKSLTESNDERYVFRTKSNKAPSSFNHLFDFYLKEHNLLIERNTGKKRVFYSLRSAHATTVMNLDKVPIRDLSKQLGNSVEMIQKHYDRATGDAIVENVRAPIARQALFNTDKVSDIYKSNKKHKEKP